ncbi:MAG: hypothetical protein II180_14060, partial [Proteobacteria bacterium]|nr:hypothetical protein [Pseudomonadota bacterium]
SGIIVDVKKFTRANGDEMSPGVNQVVRVYIAQKRKSRQERSAERRPRDVLPTAIGARHKRTSRMRHRRIGE